VETAALVHILFSFPSSFLFFSPDQPFLPFPFYELTDKMEEDLEDGSSRPLVTFPPPFSPSSSPRVSDRDEEEQALGNGPERPPFPFLLASLLPLFGTKGFFLRLRRT